MDIVSKEEGDGTPDQKGHHHDRGDLHDPESLPARFMDTLNVVPPEVHRHQNAEARRKQVRSNSETRVSQGGNLVEEVAQVLTGADHADRTSENVVENQGRNRQTRHEVVHRVAHHDVNPASNKHAARFQVHGTHSETEQHHSQDEPRRSSSHRVFRNAAGVERGGGQIAKNHGRRSPERYDRKRYGRCNDHLCRY